MSIAWGPALDAEVAYRHQQVRNDYHRRWTWRRKPAQSVSAQSVPTQSVSTQQIPAYVGTTHRRPAQQIPAQRVPAPLIPIRPVDQERTSAHAA